MIAAWIGGLWSKVWGYITIAGATALAALAIVGLVLRYGGRKKAEGAQEEKGKAGCGRSEAGSGYAACASRA